MNENKKLVVKMWFEKANSDIKNIENNLVAHNIPVDTVCFHAQQVIEKILKGVLVYFGGLTQLYPSIKGIFNGLTDTFNSARHQVDVGSRVRNTAGGLLL